MPNIVDRITVGNVDIIITDTNPSTGGLTLPIGAFGIALDGSGVFYKSGSLSTDWGKFLRNNDPVSITAVGTITTGVWNGTAITDTYISSAANWNTAYSNRITSLTTTGNNGSSSLISNVLNIPTYTLVGLNGQPLNTNLTSISALSYVSSSFVKMTAAGTFSLDTNVYLINNQTITLSGDVTGSGTTSITTSILNTIVTGKLLTGYVSGAGTIAATDSILSAIQKLNGNVNAVVSGVSSVFGRTGAVVATSGDYTTTLVIEGTNLYFTNSRAISSLLTGYISGAGTIAATDSILSAIQKLNGNVSALVTGVSSVFGRTGNVVATSGDYTTTLVTEGTNLYFTNSRAINSLLTGYISGAGVISATDSVLISIQKLNGNVSALVTGVSSVNGLTGSVALTGTLNRVSISAANVFDISANYIGQSSITTLGTIISGVWNGTSILDTYISSAANWNTAYSNRITSLTTTGNSGAATLVSNVLNIPTHTLAGLGGQPLNTNLTSLSNLTFVSGAFVKMTAAGTFSLDTNTYLINNQTITLSGDVAGSGTTAITTTISNVTVTGKLITGYISGAGTIAATDSVLSAIQKLNGNVYALVTGVSSVFGRTGAVVATLGDYNTTLVNEGTNLYYTQSRFDTAFSGKTTTNLTEGTNLYFTNIRTIGSVLTGYISGTGTLSATDSILSAIQKLNGNIALVSGAIVYTGLWNASTNTPTLVSGTGTKGTMYKVSVAGTTLIDGINQWNINDMIVFNGTTWDKLDGVSNEVTSVNGATGTIISTIVNNQGVTGSYTANALTLSLGALTGVTSINGLVITANTGVITTGIWNGTSIIDTYISSASIWNAKQNALSGTGFVKSTAGVISYDTNTYLTANQTITLSGDVTGSGSTAITTTISNATVTGKLLTGYVSGAGTIAATDSILSAIQKLNGNISAATAGVTSVSGTLNRITSTGGSTPVIDISASYVGQSSITTLGTITTGVWTGTSISTTYTDAKIKGSVAATAGLIPFGTGVLDTLTSNAQLFFSTTNGLTVVNKSFFGSSTVPTALVDIDVSTTSYSSLRIRQSSAQPTVPNAGDIYNLNGTIILANTNLLINSTATPHSTLQANGSVALSYVTKSTTYTLTISDYVVELTGASFTVTLPTAVGIMGRIYIIKNTSGGIKTIATTLSQTIDGSTTQTISGRNWAVLQSTGINWIIIG